MWAQADGSLFDGSNMLILAPIHYMTKLLSSNTYSVSTAKVDSQVSALTARSSFIRFANLIKRTRRTQITATKLFSWASNTPRLLFGTSIRRKVSGGKNLGSTCSLIRAKVSEIENSWVSCLPMALTAAMRTFECWCEIVLINGAIRRSDSVWNCCGTDRASSDAHAQLSLLMTGNGSTIVCWRTRI